MQNDDFNGGEGIPDDELIGGPREADLGDLSGAGDVESEGVEGKPSRRGSGGVRARSSSGPRKAAAAKSSAAPAKAAKKKVAAKKKGAKKGAKKTARKAAARAGARKAGGKGKKAKRGRR